MDGEYGAPLAWRSIGPDAVRLRVVARRPVPVAGVLLGAAVGATTRTVDGATLVLVVGEQREGARAEAQKLADRAAGRLAGFGEEAELLRLLPYRLIDRDR